MSPTTRHCGQSVYDAVLHSQSSTTVLHHSQEEPMASDAIVGLQEIADLLEVNRRTPHAWSYRRLLPEPDYNSINGLRAWNRQTIIDWAAQTGRLPSSLRDEATTEVVIPRSGTWPVGVVPVIGQVVNMTPVEPYAEADSL